MHACRALLELDDVHVPQLGERAADRLNGETKKIGDYAWSTPTTAVQLDQRGCHYSPHVLGLQTNQKLTM